MDLKLTDLIGPDKLVRFSYYQDGNLYYEIYYGNQIRLTIDKSECFIFPVPISDIDGNAKFLAQDKSIYFMRWIKKQLNEIKCETCDGVGVIFKHD